MASVLGKRKAPSSSSAASVKVCKPISTNVAKKGTGTPKITATPALKKKKNKNKSLEATEKAGPVKKIAAKAKRVKKREEKEDEDDDEEEEEEVDESLLSAQEIFRRHFEAQFKPIEEPKRKKARAAGARGEDGDEAASSDEEGEDIFEDEGADGQEGEGEEWSGLSGEDEDNNGSDEEEDYEDDIEENPVIEVVDHTKSKPQPVASMSKRELKAFMSMLANDLALQRLLSESHLLARHTVTPFSNPTAAAKTFSEGRLRQRQADLRTQALARGVSGVGSVFTQDKMPMAIRKGIVAAAAGREAKRRRQARENGIVLEKEAGPAPGNKAGKKAGRAERGVDGPAVGRMRGAELRLSERDVQSIEGGGSGRGGRGGRGGGRGGRGRR
ncbi:uncharacterized protein LY79DRAFT_689051 [Colletotrichum navitas]|uniref:Protein FAF1 n=1 Tax=Colletotrichum navitas TaxID=681940 RepID=A0AAD8PXL2_9PEZI|nr:uncharacterized protein LY79DRAFT_689051 [Colletotrichum navitas]KAK1586048.1 hypothetical protein LY79DRAFT_689051 [Colletotrichum navitas]